MEKLKRLHQWLKAHKAYTLGLLAAFPELWAQSTELQAHLPATVVSHVTSMALIVRFGFNVRATLSALPKPDDTDQAGA